MLTAAGIITRANQIAKSPHYVSQGLDGLNAILGDLCEERDFALARGEFDFTFNPGLTSLFGSGPYNLPLDYLRTSGSSGAEGYTKSAWFLYPAPAFPAGQPMPLIPIDLAEFDQYPKLPSQGIPSVMATDMGGPLSQRIVLATTAALTAGSPVMLIAASSLSNGLSVAGEGITPGTTILSGAGVLLSTVGDTTIGSQILTNLATVGSTISGMSVSGTGIQAGSLVQTVDGPTQITIDLPATAPGVGVTLNFGGASLLLSKPATATIAAASVFFGVAPVCYIYPAPVGAYPAIVRYQRKMPPITDTSKIPWFPNEGYLIDKLAAFQTEITDDSRTTELEQRAAGRLQRYIDMVDDKTNRAQQTQLDPRLYGRGSAGGLRITKVAGW